MTKLPDQRTPTFSNFQKQPAAQQPALSSSYRVTRESFIPSVATTPRPRSNYSSVSSDSLAKTAWMLMHQVAARQETTLLSTLCPSCFGPAPWRNSSNVHLHAPSSIYSILFSLDLHVISDVAVDAVYVETFVPVARCWYASIYHDEETRRSGCRGVSNKWERGRARCVCQKRHR